MKKLTGTHNFDPITGEVSLSFTKYFSSLDTEQKIEVLEAARDWLIGVTADMKIIADREKKGNP